MKDVQPMILDVREQLRQGKEPLPDILKAVNSLAPGQALRVRATFEPIPLYAVLGNKGYSHQAVRHAEGDWEILFIPGDKKKKKAKSGGTASYKDPGGLGWPSPSKSLDNRGLLPPEPMMRILEALEHMPKGSVLQAINDREPAFLFPELEARGAAIYTDKRDDGVYIKILRGDQK